MASLMKAMTNQAGPAMRKQALSLTVDAASRLKHLLTQRQQPYLRISLMEHGCGGLSYTLNYAGPFKVLQIGTIKDHGVNPEPFEIRTQNRSEFVFINPNATRKCGCGESFMTTGNANPSSSAKSIIMPCQYHVEPNFVDALSSV